MVPLAGPLRWVLRAAAAAAATACTLLAYAPVRGVSAHGFLALPRARNVQHNSDWCPGCLNGARVCGDPDEGRPGPHEAFGKYASPPRIAARYPSGGTIAVRVRLTANHMGRWSLRLCPLPDPSPAGERRALTQRCLDRWLLRRADGGGPFTPVPGHLYDFHVRYRLPRGLTCRRCVLQWTYETGNSCRPPGLPGAAFAGSNLETCGRWMRGERFVNCADISVINMRG